MKVDRKRQGEEEKYNNKFVKGGSPNMDLPLTAIRKYMFLQAPGCENAWNL